MTVADWARTSFRRVADDGIDGAVFAGRDLWAGVRRRAARGVATRLDGGEGTNVFGREWDLLVVLDCARPEFFESASADVDRPALRREPPTIRSVGSSSSAWIAEAFVDRYAEEAARTTYVTANPHSTEIGAAGPGRLREVWRDGYDETVETIPPRAVTDAAITATRDDDTDRVIAHYMQPHPPFIGETDVDEIDGMTIDNGDRGVTLPKAIRMGLVSPAEAFDAHVANLAAVLPDVETLLDNAPAGDAVITADHGQAFGRPDELFVTGHPSGAGVDALRIVPWIETDCRDTGSYAPGRTDETTDVDRAAQLAALGYR